MIDSRLRGNDVIFSSNSGLERININGTDRDMVALKKKIHFTSNVLEKLNRTDISEKAMKIQNEWLEKLSSIPQISSFYKRSAEWVEEFGGSEFDFSRLQDELKGHVNSFLDKRIDPTLVKDFDPSMDKNYNPILVKARDEVAKIQLPSYDDGLVEYAAKVRNVVEYHMSKASDVIKYQHYMTGRNVFLQKHKPLDHQTYQTALQTSQGKNVPQALQMKMKPT